MPGPLRSGAMLRAALVLVFVSVVKAQLPDNPEGA